MYKGHYILLFLLILTGCTDLKDNTRKTEYALNCVVQPDIPITAELATTFNNPRLISQPITSALLTISDSGNITDTLSINSAGMYVSEYPFWRNTNISLHAYLTNGQILEASTYIPSELVIELIKKTNDTGILTYHIRIAPKTYSQHSLFLRHQAFPQDSSTGAEPIESIEYDPYLKGSPFFTLTGNQEHILNFSSKEEITHVFTLVSENIYHYLRVEETFNPFTDGLITPVFPSNISGGTGIFGFYEEYTIK